MNKKERKVTVNEVFYALSHYFLKMLLPMFALKKIVAHCEGLQCHFCYFITKKYLFINLYCVEVSLVLIISCAPIFHL